IRCKSIPEWAEGLYYKQGDILRGACLPRRVPLRRAQGQGERRGALHLRDARGPQDRRRRSSRRARRRARVARSLASTNLVLAKLRLLGGWVNRGGVGTS